MNLIRRKAASFPVRWPPGRNTTVLGGWLVWQGGSGLWGIFGRVEGCRKRAAII